jgi:hypothetical protein
MPEDRLTADGSTEDDRCFGNRRPFKTSEPSDSKSTRELRSLAPLRVEFDFKSAGVTFLDFNVARATQAISALRCQ